MAANHLPCVNEWWNKGLESLAKGQTMLRAIWDRILGRAMIVHTLKEHRRKKLSRELLDCPFFQFMMISFTISLIECKWIINACKNYIHIKFCGTVHFFFFLVRILINNVPGIELYHSFLSFFYHKISTLTFACSFFVCVVHMNEICNEYLFILTCLLCWQFHSTVCQWEPMVGSLSWF